jgi:hypothetical protein
VATEAQQQAAQTEAAQTEAAQVGMAATPSTPSEEILEEMDNPIERLKLLSGNDDEIGRFLDAIEVSSPREREMLHEISRTQPLARLDLFPQAHRNMVEALESLSRHGYRGTGAGKRFGPFRFLAKWAVELVARYVVVSHVKNVSRGMRNLYGLREIQALPDSPERVELRRARSDAERMVEALQSRELGLPKFLIAGAAVPILAAIGRATGILGDYRWAGLVAAIGVLIAATTSWVILRGAALASRRIRLATRGPHQTLWNAIGWCGKPPKDQSRTFVIVSVVLTIGAWIIVPLLIGLSFAT